MDWVANGSFKGDLEMLDKSGVGVGKIHVAVKFERPGAPTPSAFARRVIEQPLSLPVPQGSDSLHGYRPVLSGAAIYCMCRLDTSCMALVANDSLEAFKA